MNERPALQRPGVALRPSGTLVDRAVANLASGPMSTARLAAEVLALRGNPKAAAAAVFALLGSDPRVHVDGAGVWSLASSEEAKPAVAFRDEEWVVLDVETTGGSPARGHRVIEIAAVKVAAGRIVGEYSTLVNPRRAIPRMITSLTGIADGAVQNAPYFEQIAPAVTAALGGRVFVGHNAGFDWRFVCAELERCTGRTLIGRQFCTLRVARKLLPNLPSRSLGSLAEYYGVEMITHHRALDDAMATARLLLRFLDTLAEHGVEDWHGLDVLFRKSPRKRPRSARPMPMDAA
jgi:DNA polymerase III epsilon subunit family exonuclease